METLIEVFNATRYVTMPVMLIGGIVALWWITRDIFRGNGD